MDRHLYHPIGITAPCFSCLQFKKPSVCPYHPGSKVSYGHTSEFQAAFREITPISFSDDEVKVPFAAVDAKKDKNGIKGHIHVDP